MPLLVMTGVESVWCNGGSTFVTMVGTGEVKAFGWNDNGELGLGDTEGRFTPEVTFATETDIAEIRGFTAVTCLLFNDGFVKCVGNNAFGGLGTSSASTEKFLTLQQIKNLPTTVKPTKQPTLGPTKRPSKPTRQPTLKPSKKPSKTPTTKPSKSPTRRRLRRNQPSNPL